MIGAAVLITRVLGVVCAVTVGILPPGCSRTRGLRIQRLLDRTFVITGLLAIPIWLLTPIPYAFIAGLSLYAVAITFTLWSVPRMNHQPGSDSAGS